MFKVREHHPVKQGLRLDPDHFFQSEYKSPRAPSSKTRIKTLALAPCSLEKITVREHHPVKQGLRLLAVSMILNLKNVREHHPVKQGLRPFSSASLTFKVACPRAPSSKTRIKTNL